MTKKWFKNLMIFYFQNPFNLPLEALQEKLAENLFTPCKDLEWSTQGWTPPLPEEGELFSYSINHCHLMTLKKQEKLLPPNVIREYLNEKIEEIELKEQRKVRKREKEMIKEQVIQELLPRAFHRNAELSGYIDTAHNWLIINTSSRKKAEEFTNFLRLTLGTLAVVPVQVQHSPASYMAYWLNQEELPEHFNVGEECKLVANEESVTCKQLDLFSSEIKAHLNVGRLVEYIELIWKDNLSFLLDNELNIRRLKFIAIAEAAEEEEFDQQNDFSLMTMEIAQMLPQLFKAFGGLANFVKYR